MSKHDVPPVDPPGPHERAQQEIQERGARILKDIMRETKGGSESGGTHRK